MDSSFRLPDAAAADRGRTWHPDERRMASAPPENQSSNALDFRQRILFGALESGVAKESSDLSLKFLYTASVLDRISLGSI